MRKTFLLLAVVALAVALAAPPAMAAEFKFTGVYRVRGVTANDADFQTSPAKNIAISLTCPTSDSQGNRTCNDRRSETDTLFRPRFTATDEGGRVVGMIEYDIGNANVAVGGDAGRRVSGSSTSITASENSERPFVVADKYVIDFLIPGTTLRARWGRTDRPNPGAQLVWGSGGTHRNEGYDLYGPIFGAVRMTAWTTQKAEGTTTESDDSDAYFVGLEWRPAPQISIYPWLGRMNANVSKAERRGTLSGSPLPDIETDYYGGTLGAKFGVFNLELTGVVQRGTIDWKQKSIITGVGIVTPEIKDVDIEAYAAQLNADLKLGPFTIGFQGMISTGDKDPICGTSCRSDIGTTIVSKAAAIGHQQNRNSNMDTSWKRFFSGKLNPTALTADGAWYVGPQLVTNNRYSTLSAGRSIRDPGSDGSFANGMQVYELIFGWQILSNLKLDGNLSLIRSAEKRQDIINGSTGVVTTKFSTDKDVGTEVDVSLRWNLYKSVYAQLTGSILMPGEYGKVTELSSAVVATKDQKDDAHWAVLSEIRYSF